METDFSPAIGENIADYGGTLDAIVVAKHQIGNAGDQNDYMVICLMPDNDATPYVVWRMMANGARMEVMWGNYVRSIIDAANIYKDKIGVLA